MKPLDRYDVLPAILHPSEYTGARGGRSQEQWYADSVAAYLNGKMVHAR